MPDLLETRDVVLTQLRRVQLAGEDAPTADELMDRSGLSPTQFGVTLGVLLDEGSIGQDAAGRCFLARDPDYPGPESAAEAPPEEPEPEPEREEGTWALTERGAEAVDAGAREADGEPPVHEVRLTPATVDALSAEAVGVMVAAGVAEARAVGATFVLVVDS